MSNLCTFQFFKSFFEKKIVTLFLELFISSSYTRVPKTTIIYGTVTEICKEKVVIMYILYLFTLLITRKIKTLKKWKTHLEMSPFYTCVPKIMIIWCMLPEIWKATNFFFIFWGHFLPFYPINDPEN